MISIEQDPPLTHWNRFFLGGYRPNADTVFYFDEGREIKRAVHLEAGRDRMARKKNMIFQKSYIDRNQ